MLKYEPADGKAVFSFLWNLLSVRWCHRTLQPQLLPDCNIKLRESRLSMYAKKECLVDFWACTPSAVNFASKMELAATNWASA